MKQREFEKCFGCGLGLATVGVHFYRVEVEQFVLDHKAIQPQHGLELMTSPALAAALGPDEDLAVGIDKASMLVCASCRLHMPVAGLMEVGTMIDQADLHNRLTPEIVRTIVVPVITNGGTTEQVMVLAEMLVDLLPVEKGIRLLGVTPSSLDSRDSVTVPDQLALF